MKKLVLLLLIMLTIACTPSSKRPSTDAQQIRGRVEWQLQHYPQARLIDIYKSCFQDYMGAEHLVSNRAEAQRNLMQEISTMNLDSMADWLYEPCGIDSQYYRVSLRAIAQGILPVDSLLDSFVASTQETQPDVKAWQQRWQQIQSVITDMHLQLPFYEHDSSTIAAVLDVGGYALSHSDEFKHAYHPHYRIVERSRFERSLKPILDKHHSNSQPALSTKQGD